MNRAPQAQKDARGHSEVSPWALVDLTGHNGAERSGLICAIMPPTNKPAAPSGGVRTGKP